MRDKIFPTLVGIALLGTACSGTHQSIAPVPQGLLQPGAHGVGGAISGALSGDDEDAGPSVTVTASVIITVPTGASAAQSVSISVNGGTPTIANLSSGSPGCVGSNPLVCTVSVSAPTAADVFALMTFSGSNGTGSVLATGKVFQKITTTSTTVLVTLLGTPSAIVLALQRSKPRECDPKTKIPLYVMVMDCSANIIIGSYGETVSLADSDVSGKTSLTLSSISDSSSAVKVTYNGLPLKSATISASASGVISVTNAALKPTQMVYVGNYYATDLPVWPSTANGNAAPARTISGPHTMIGNDAGVALDGACDLDVASTSTNSILVFSAGATGDVAPVRTISGTNTLLSSPEDVAVDAAGNMYVANTGAKQILEFAANANGNVAPIANISGSNTDLSAYRDTIGPTGKIYTTGAQSVVVFAAGANGNATPVAIITDSVTPFGQTRGIAVDPSGKIYVGDAVNNNVSVFPANANGNVAPIEAISGSNSLINGPNGISIDYSGNMAVSSSGGNGILVFAKGSNGNVAPKREIFGSNTGLNNPVGNAL